MPREKYDQTEAPGQTRVRSHQQIITTPMGSVPELFIRQQVVIRHEDGTEKVLEEIAPISVALTPERLAKPFPLRSLIDDSLLGGTSTGYEAQTHFYGFVRDCQLENDQKLSEQNQSPQE
jgi:hypothetical protein